MNLMNIIAAYIIGINIITIIIYGIDKLKAMHHSYRISESTLVLLAVIGGSIGALSGMLLFHHKTRKFKFKYGIPLIILCQIGILLLVYTRIFK